MTATVGWLASGAAIAALLLAGGLAVAGRDGAARRAHRAGAALAAVAVAALGWGLATGDFQLAYVAEVTDRATTWPHRLAGLWGGMAGSLLLWSALVALWGVGGRPVGVERAALAWLAAAFLVVAVLVASPFDRLPAPAIDGLGATPILRHPAMLFHPPVLYLGLTGLAAPWAAVLGGRAGDVVVRAGLLRCVGLLTIGMVAGAHWAYVELGWGGYWAWDPVENTALLPWLAALGALHGLVARRRHGRPGAAAPVLATAALLLAVVGTLLTRSGAAPSVHAFGEDPAVGWSLLALTVAVAAATAVLLRRGLRPHRPTEDPVVLAGSSVTGDGALGRLTEDPVVAAGSSVVGGASGRVTEDPVVAAGSSVAGGGWAAIAPASPAAGRRGEVLAVAAQPWLAGFAVLVVLLGTLRPLVGSEDVAVDGSYYATLLAPVGAVVVALVLRFRPIHLAHLGALVLAAGVVGSTFASSATATVAAGDALTVAGWEVRNEGARVAGERTVVAPVTVWHDGDRVAALEPRLVAFPERGVLLAETSLRSTPLTDVQVVLRDAGDDGQALLEVHVRPLVWLVWWGGLLVGAAALWASVPWGRMRRRDGARG